MPTNTYLDGHPLRFFFREVEVFNEALIFLPRLLLGLERAVFCEYIGVAPAPVPTQQSHNTSSTVLAFLAVDQDRVIFFPE